MYLAFAEQDKKIGEEVQKKFGCPSKELDVCMKGKEDKMLL